MKPKRNQRLIENKGIWTGAAILGACLGLQPALRADDAKTQTSATNAAPALDLSASGEPNEYNNWFDIGVGGNFVGKDKGQFLQQKQIPANAFGGVSEFHYEKFVGESGLFTMDGRGIFNNRDYLLKFNLSSPDKGYVRAGFRQFRTWYDGSGGFFPQNGQWFSLYDDELHIDRGKIWFEAGLTLPNIPAISFKYQHQYRNGTKDSTSWGDTTLTGGLGVRSIVPTYLDINETRDIMSVDLTHTLGKTDFGAGIRYELSNQRDSRNIHRRPGEIYDRYVTSKDYVKSDIFSAHAFTETHLNDQILFTTGYLFTSLNTDLSGSRIYGAGYDPVYDPLFGRRQTIDQGFIDLSGGSEMNQYVFNGNLQWTPTKSIVVVPSVRVQKEDLQGVSDYIATSISPLPFHAPVEDPTLINSERGVIDVAEQLELRYQGIRNVLLYSRGEWTEGQGDLTEQQLQVLTGNVDLSRLTDDDRFTQKYTIGANWYPLQRLSFGAQYYHKIHRISYNHLIDSTPNGSTSDNRYPAFLVGQDFDTDDMNVRANYHPFSTLHLVTRYDFQFSTVDTTGAGLDPTQSSQVTTHIIGETVSWTPLTRLYTQVGFNYAIDNTDTPAEAITSGSVQDGKNSYWNASFMAGYALNQKTDLQTQYTYYRADDYQNNATVGMPYGAGAEEHGVTLAIVRHIRKNLRLTVKYGFFDYTDDTSGGHNNFTDHLIYSGLRYYF